MRSMVVLVLMLLLLKSTWFSAAAVLPQLRAEWGLSTAAGGALTVAVQLGFCLGAVVSGLLSVSDIVPPRRLIFASALGAAAANTVLLAAPGFGAGLATRFATGFFIAGVYPPALKLASTWYQRGRGGAIGLMVGALTFSSAVPHLVNGLGGLAWRTVIIGTSILTVLGAFGMLAGVREGPYPFPAARLDPRQLGAVVRNRGVRLATLGYLCHMWELYAMWSWFLLFSHDTFARFGRTPLPAAAYLTFAVIGIGGLANWVGGVLGDRYGREKVAIGMLAVSATCAATIGLGAELGVWPVVLIGLVWGFSVVGDSVQFSTLVTELADQSYVGTALTLQMALGFGVTGITIWIVPAIQAVAGWTVAFLLLVPGPLLGIVVMRRLLHARTEDRLPVAVG